MNTQTFQTTILQEKGKCFIRLNFDPNKVWGEKEKHHIHGTINNHMIRGQLGVAGETYFLTLGAAWCRDSGLGAGDEVEVSIYPEGPQADNIAPDIASALTSEAAAQAFFEALPTFYRKNYIRWIESAKRPETRANRIKEMVELLKAGQRER